MSFFAAINSGFIRFRAVYSAPACGKLIFCRCYNRLAGCGGLLEFVLAAAVVASAGGQG
jgi:hypothetical protein